METSFYAARMAALEAQNYHWALACLALFLAALAALWCQGTRISELKDECADHVAVIEAHALEAAALRERADQLQADGLILAEYFARQTSPEDRPAPLSDVMIRTFGRKQNTHSISLDEWRAAAPAIRRELSASERYGEPCDGRR
jgi:hypothetical protein